MERYNANSDLYRTLPLSELLSLRGKTIVVTGGGRGLGLACARACAEAGASIAIVDILEHPSVDLDSMSNELEVRVEFYRADITNKPVLATTFERIVDTFGAIHGLINAAGMGISGSIVDFPLDAIEKVMNVNVSGTIVATQLAAQQIVKQGSGGAIINISSIGGHRTIPGQKNVAVYSASKGAVLAFTKAAAVELASCSIRVNSVSPGYFLTDMSPGYRDKDVAKLQFFESLVPQGRFADRSELKGVVAFLLSQAASYITGQDITVDGGISA